MLCICLIFINLYFYIVGITDRKWILAAKSTCTTLVSSLSGGVFAILYRYIIPNSNKYQDLGIDFILKTFDYITSLIDLYLKFFSLYVTDGKLDILMIINGILGALVGKDIYNV